ncbi:MAG TPA: murein L,D-transpeptidase catalytic domain family protein [Xanthomonadales bacterium]|nr:murein L,D-transpeptidase catalytic domain family protein [Xanthomonadales bacterium]
MRRFALLAALAASVFAPFASAQSVLDAAALAKLAPAADPQALEVAFNAMQCAQAHGQGTNATKLTVIDYSKPSLEPRMWVFDLAQQKLLFEEVVAHGKNSGANMTTSFSNVDGSLQTSLGLFLTRETYQGGNGYSLRLDGLDKGLNDRAMARAIVIHGAPYVDPVAGAKQGRLGRSFGCPAVRQSVATPLIDAIKGGNFVFSYYPGDALAARMVADCPAVKAGGVSTVATAAP